MGEGIAPPPETNENIKKFADNSIKTLTFVNFPEFIANFHFKKLILIKIKAIMMYL